MGRMYVLSNTLTAVAAANTLAEIGCAANKVLLIHRISLSNSSSETDDSALISYGTYTATGTGTAATAQRAQALETQLALLSKPNPKRIEAPIAHGNTIKAAIEVSSP